MENERRRISRRSVTDVVDVDSRPADVDSMRDQGVPQNGDEEQRRVFDGESAYGWCGVERDDAVQGEVCVARQTQRIDRGCGPKRRGRYHVVDDHAASDRLD